MKVNGPTTHDGSSAGGAAAGVAGANEGPVGRAVAALATVDRAMAEMLRAIADAGPVDGLPAARLISLAAGATGWDIRYLRRTSDTLSAMPGVWTAFDQGELSWSQLRGITTAAKALSMTDRHTLDGQLSGAIGQNATAEPDRIVEVAGDLAGRLDDAAQERRDTNTAKGIGLRLIPDLFGGSTIHGQLDDQLTALVSNAIHSAADAPVAEGHQPTDADGKPIPRSWLAPTRRAAQLAEALGRVCADWLAGHTSHTGQTNDVGHSRDTDGMGNGDSVANSDEGADSDGRADGDADCGGMGGSDANNGVVDDGGADSSGRVDREADGGHGGATGDSDEAGTNSACGTDDPAANRDDDDATDTMTDSDTSDTPAGGRAGRGARPTALVIVDLNDLIDTDARAHSTDGTPAATARLLWRLAGGRKRQSNARIHALTCDATHIPVLTHGDIPIAIGDATDPIPLAVRRAATARDQGCRFPGCDRPAQFTDLHHVIWREHGGPTDLSNLVSLCRTCHNLVHERGWQLTMYDDGRLTVQRGRYRFTSRPRLRPPPPRPSPKGPSRARPPPAANPAAADPPPNGLPF